MKIHPGNLLMLPVAVLLALILAACDTAQPGSQGGGNGGGGDGGPGNKAATATALIATVTAIAEPTDESNTRTPIDLAQIDPCALLTSDEVSEIMGQVDYNPRLLTQEADHTACMYVDPGLVVDAPRLHMILELPQSWEFIPMINPEARRVQGLGDTALTSEFNGWRSLWVLLDGRAVLQLHVFPMELEKAEQLARKVIEKLP